MFGVPKTLDEAIVYADRLVKRHCVYGGGSFCDCKFLPEGYENLDRKTRFEKKALCGEDSGCCEARALGEFLKGLQAKPERLTK